MTVGIPHQDNSALSNTLSPNASNRVYASLPLYNANPIQAITRFFKKYLVFSGRASRAEFWWPVFLLFVAENTVSFFSYIFGQYIFEQPASAQFQTFTSSISVMVLCLYVAVFLPTISCACRRFHDCNKSGKWLWGLLPCCFIMMPLSAIYGFILFLRFVKMSHHLPRYFYYHVFITVVCLFIGIAALIVLITFLVHESDPRGSRFDVKPHGV